MCLTVPPANTKTFYNLVNLPNHDKDFGIYAEWICFCSIQWQVNMRCYVSFDKAPDALGELAKGRQFYFDPV